MEVNIALFWGKGGIQIIVAFLIDSVKMLLSLYYVLFWRINLPFNLI
jgi:hypothetical protein